VMADIIDDLARDVKAMVKEACAKVAEIQRLTGPAYDNNDAEYRRGYNDAVADIAAKIRRL